jgi:hypothetical protein
LGCSFSHRAQTMPQETALAIPAFSCVYKGLGHAGLL